ncbi:Os1348 family NHLP clan protein [Dictyobacter kobayashii]|uniref:Extradiol ring-cleavage dioxygenase LigAB LigA subunit domain-containing protein n=1 Tax=Dictyobacter kobayashii TaxID=2014872 RepID=A0A402AVG2_9CHLR|nr:Os1348 family NHLP clan protein [Dictyobacter kobayashii]GCE23077.1 hypothetical protein KDK_68770 [Dictyobacter kobayashii]
MTWTIINRILGQAALDKSFEKEFLRDPVVAAKRLGYELTDEEIEAFAQSKADTLSAFSKNLLHLLPSQ